MNRLTAARARRERRKRAAERAALGITKLEPWRRSTFKSAEIKSATRSEIQGMWTQIHEHRRKAGDPAKLFRETDAEQCNHSQSAPETLNQPPA